MGDKLICEKENDYWVRFIVNKHPHIQDKNVAYMLSTQFGIQDEEDNILDFYYNILDIAHGIISGSLSMYNLPKNENIRFETHEYSFHTKELLKEYMKFIAEQREEYNKFKLSL